MKKLIVVGLLLSLAGCYYQIPFGIEDKARELCEPNGGLEILELDMRKDGVMCKAVCENKVEIYYWMKFEK